jgi:hypothetical protein
MRSHGMAHHQCLKLLRRQRDRLAIRWRLARPRKDTLMQPARRTPDPEPIVHQQLDAVGTRVGKQIAVMGVGAAKDAHHRRQQSIGASAHVHGLDCKPDRVDTDHCSNSRNHAALTGPASSGQLTLTWTSPRAISMSKSDLGAAFTLTGTNVALAGVIWRSAASGDAVATALASDIAGPSAWPVDSTTQRRSKLALMPCAIATRAMDTPRPRHCATSSALNSFEYRRRARPGSNRDAGIVFTYPPKFEWTRASFTPRPESRVACPDAYFAAVIVAGQQTVEVSLPLCFGPSFHRIGCRKAVTHVKSVVENRRPANCMEPRLALTGTEDAAMT